MFEIGRYEFDMKIHSLKGISKNPAFYGLNPSPFSGREGYKEFLEKPLIERGHAGCWLLDAVFEFVNSFNLILQILEFNLQSPGADVDFI